MAKHKNYHNYNNYSNNVKTETVETEVTEEVKENVVEIKENAVEESTTVEPETVVTPESIKPTIGTVVDCPRLRVRAAASTNADVLCEIESGSEVTIDETKSTKDFYAVCTSAGVEGFCMKKFIVPVK